MKKGFTLIEMMVAVGIFAIVMVISSGSLFSVLDANSKSQSLKSVMNNLNLALEGMSRNMRMGTNYHCGSSGDLGTPANCATGSDFIAFESTFGSKTDLSDQIIYRLNGNKIERSVRGGAVGSYVPLTAPEVVIESLYFFVTGTGSDGLQPKVIMVIQGRAGKNERSQTEFKIQTVVSQRQLDLDI